MPSMSKQFLPFLYQSKEEFQRKIASFTQAQRTTRTSPGRASREWPEVCRLTDPDCRLMKNERRIEPAYAVQTAVDAKHSLIVDYELTQDAADNNHLASLAASAKKKYSALRHYSMC